MQVPYSAILSVVCPLVGYDRSRTMVRSSIRRGKTATYLIRQSNGSKQRDSWGLFSFCEGRLTSYMIGGTYLQNRKMMIDMM